MNVRSDRSGGRAPGIRLATVTALLCLLNLTVLAGCIGVSGESTGAPGMATGPTATPTPTLIPYMPPPTRAPFAPAVADSDDPLTIVLGGRFGNGGYWTWDDIANLLGVYSNYGEFVTVEVEGQEYTGVPVSYLLDYADINSRSLSLIAFSRDEQSFTYPTSQITDCQTCLIARLPDDTLALVLPNRVPQIVNQLVRIEVR